MGSRNDSDYDNLDQDDTNDYFRTIKSERESVEDKGSEIIWIGTRIVCMLGREQ